MSSILIIENDRRDPLGYLGDAIEVRGLTPVVVRPPEGDAIPSLDGHAAVVVLGGPQGAYQADLHPYLDDEMALIRQAVENEIPVLGLCLGSQLIAHALGGRAYLAESPEVAVLSPELTPEAAADPVASLLDRPVLAFHQDTLEVPPQATVLARSDRFTLAFRCGSALAIQPHPEASADQVERWLPGTALPQRAGVDGSELIADMRTSVDPGDAANLFDAWLDQIPATIS